MNNTLIIYATFGICFLIGMLVFSVNLEQKNDLEFAKSGLEQCRTNGFEKILWVKNCKEYIQMRNEGNK